VNHICASIDTSAVVIHYEEALYQVYGLYLYLFSTFKAGG